MAEQHDDIQMVKIGIGLVATGAMGMMGWIGKRQVTRIDEIEKNYVGKKTFNDKIKEIEKKIDEGNKSTHERLDKILMFLVEDGRNHGK